MYAAIITLSAVIYTIGTLTLLILAICVERDNPARIYYVSGCVNFFLPLLWTTRSITYQVSIPHDRRITIMYKVIIMLMCSACPLLANFFIHADDKPRSEGSESPYSMLQILSWNVSSWFASCYTYQLYELHDLQHDNHESSAVYEYMRLVVIAYIAVMGHTLMYALNNYISSHQRDVEWLLMAYILYISSYVMCAVLWMMIGVYRMVLYAHHSLMMIVMRSVWT